MQPNRWDISIYRIQHAEEDLRAARLSLENGLYRVAVNRSYYSIFHAIRSVNVTDEFDALKYSSVIAHFNQYHVHTGDFVEGTYKIIDSAYRIREKCDYSDFFDVSKEEAEEQIRKAEIFLKEVQNYLANKS